jgi:hypothetical protein
MWSKGHDIYFKRLVKNPKEGRVLPSGDSNLLLQNGNRQLDSRNSQRMTVPMGMVWASPHLSFKLNMSCWDILNGLSP